MPSPGGLLWNVCEYKASFLRGKLFDLFCATCIKHFIEHIFIFNIDSHGLVEILST